MQTSAPHIDELANTPSDEPKMAVTLGRNVKRLRERGRINKTCFAAMVGIGLLLWWIASRIVPSLMPIGRVQPMRQALIVLLILGALVWFGLGVMRRHRRRVERRAARY